MAFQITPNGEAVSASIGGFNAIERIDAATVFASDAAQVPAAISNIVDELVIFGAKDHTYQISLAQTTTASIIVDIFDADIGDHVGYFQVTTPDYSDSGANLPDFIPFIATDRLAALPSGDPDGANFSGVWPQSYLKLVKSAVVEGASVYQQNTGSGDNWAINPANIVTPAQVRAWTADWDFEEVLECGPGKQYADPEQALLALSDAAYLAARAANPKQISVIPQCARANPLHRIAIFVNPRDPLSPLLPWQFENLHVPNYVSLIALDPDAAVFEHPAGATRPIFQWHQSHDIRNLTVRNTIPENPGGYAGLGTTSSARYAAHSDYVHNFMVADAEGDLLREYDLRVKGCKLIVGPNATIQAWGEGLPVNRRSLFEDMIFDCENGSYSGALAAANNSSNTVGGGEITFRRCTDASGRSGASTVSVQAKQANTNPNILRIEDCTGFAQIDIAGGTFPGNWTLEGDFAGTILDTTTGGDGFTNAPAT